MHGIVVSRCISHQWIAFIATANDQDQEKQIKKSTNSSAHWVNHNK
jgi:hypothetical protein